MLHSRGVGQGPERPVGPPGPWIAAPATCTGLHGQSLSDIRVRDHQQLLDSLSSQDWLPCVYYGMVTIRQIPAATLCKSQHLSKLDLQIIGDPVKWGRWKPPSCDTKWLMIEI